MTNCWLVLSKRPVFFQSLWHFQPSKGALDDSALGDDREGVQFAPLGDLGCGADQAYGAGERLAGVAAIHHGRRAVLVLPDGLERALAVVTVMA